MMKFMVIPHFLGVWRLRFLGGRKFCFSVGFGGGFAFYNALASPETGLASAHEKTASIPVLPRDECCNAVPPKFTLPSQAMPQRRRKS
ncbi:hypothetical protein [Lacticaseibacillus rhamnosus]|uniref:hypothetical protein n=1 Tax=Lacticaseibacillus rhamnosus TaxID=47715 RepID=UPI0021AAF1A8|nr:hypothetical protein [Lacticaseibacillus rhamnosus]